MTQHPLQSKPGHLRWSLKLPAPPRYSLLERWMLIPRSAKRGTQPAPQVSLRQGRGHFDVGESVLGVADGAAHCLGDALELPHQTIQASLLLRYSLPAFSRFSKTWNTRRNPSNLEPCFRRQALKNFWLQGRFGSLRGYGVVLRGS